MRKLEKNRITNTVRPEELKRGDKEYNFKRGKRSGNWETGYVREVKDHILTLSTNKEHHGKKIRAAYEDIKTFPRSTLLQDLDATDFTFPESYSVVQDDSDDFGSVTDLPSIFPDLEASKPAEQRNAHPNIPAPRFDEFEDLDDIDPCSSADVVEMFEKEYALWSSHPSMVLQGQNRNLCALGNPLLDISRSLFTNRTKQLSLSKAHDLPRREKDVCSFPVLRPPADRCELKSSEQRILR